MSFELRRGTKIRKDCLREEFRRITFHRKNAVQLLSILQGAGYIEIHGKIIKIKRDLRLR